jgi:hypothetical protein
MLRLDRNSLLPMTQSTRSPWMATTERRLSSEKRTIRSRSRLCARTGCGASIRLPAGKRFLRAVSIQSCLAYVDAQNEYAAKDQTGAGAGAYAQRIVSRPGKKDGLYWPTSKGEEPSPLGELIAEATGQGYRVGAGRTPYHGYYFKVLTKQGAAAPGGELEYIVRGRMIGGFALVAYPAEYRNSGVMTFIVSHDGTVFQKDLGPNTAKLAQRMTSFNPDKSWQKVTDTSPIR